MTDDIIQRIDHLRAVQQHHKELEVELASVQLLRMQLARSILGARVSEFHVAAQLKATPDEVRRWAWRAVENDPRSTHNFIRDDRVTPRERDENKRESPAQRLADRSYKADVGGSSPSAPTT